MLPQLRATQTYHANHGPGKPIAHDNTCTVIYMMKGNQQKCSFFRVTIYCCHKIVPKYLINSIFNSHHMIYNKYCIAMLFIYMQLYRPPYGRTSRVWDSLLVRKSGCAGGRGFAPPAGATVRRVFHPTRKLVRFSLLKCPSIPNSKKFWNT